MEIFTKKIIPIFLTLLILLSILPSCTFAEDQNVPPSPGSEESFDQMQIRMTTMVNETIKTLENSKEDLDDESLEDAEQLINDLESIKEEISGAENQEDLLTIKKELDDLFATAPEEIKNILPQAMGQGPGMQGSGMQNGTENLSQGFENGSGRRPEMMINRSQLPRNENETMNMSEIPEKNPEGMGEKGNFSEESIKETTENSGFFEKLVNALKSLFS